MLIVLMSIVPIFATADEASTGALAAVSPNSPPPRFERAKNKRDHWEENRVMSISKKHPTVEEAHKKLGEYYVAEHDAIREKENFAKRAKKGHALDGVPLFQTIPVDASPGTVRKRTMWQRMGMAGRSDVPGA